MGDGVVRSGHGRPFLGHRHLRSCIQAEDFDYFASVESALSTLEDWELFKRSEFSDGRPDREMVIVLAGSLWLDLHVVTPKRLDLAFVGPHRIRILFDSGCGLAELNATARREHVARGPADVEVMVSHAVAAWDLLAHAMTASARGRHAYALSLLNGSRVALGQILVGRTEPIPPRLSPTTLPKFLGAEHQEIVDATVPGVVIEAMGDAMQRLANALRDATEDMERRDVSGRLVRMRRLVEEQIERGAGS